MSEQVSQAGHVSHVRLLLHEAEDAHRLIREYVGTRESVSYGDVEDILNEIDSENERVDRYVDRVLALIDTEYVGDARHAEVEDLVNRIGEIYDRAKLRAGTTRTTKTTRTPHAQAK